MTIYTFFFFFFGFITLAGALMVLVTKNVWYAALALLGSFLGVSALYVLLGADTLAVSQIMVYVGGILVLVLFGIMLSPPRNKNALANESNRIEVKMNNRFWAILLCLFFSILLIYALLHSHLGYINPTNQSQSTIQTIGVGLMTHFVLGFELIGVLLLVAVIATTYLSRSSKI